MSFYLTKLIFIVIAYFIGSVPTSVWVGRLFYGIDVREKGSGNAGATNTIRVLGLKAGIPVLFIDIFKGWFAVFVAHFINTDHFIGEEFIYLQILLGIASVVGHIFPIYIGFRGGKGVATIAGVGIALFPIGLSIVLGIFILCLFITRIVSVSSIIGAVCFPFIIIFILHNQHLPLIILSIGVGIFIPIMHHRNIKRLLKGKEKKFYFRKIN